MVWESEHSVEHVLLTARRRREQALDRLRETEATLLEHRHELEAAETQVRYWEDVTLAYRTAKDKASRGVDTVQGAVPEEPERGDAFGVEEGRSPEVAPGKCFCGLDPRPGETHGEKGCVGPDDRIARAIRERFLGQPDLGRISPSCRKGGIPHAPHSDCNGLTPEQYRARIEAAGEVTDPPSVKQQLDAARERMVLDHRALSASAEPDPGSVPESGTDRPDAADEEQS